MKRAGFLFFAVLLMAVFMASGAEAESKKKCSSKEEKERHSRKDGAYGGAFFEHMIKKLDLDDGQMVEANKIKHSYKKSTIRQEADIKVAKVELQELLAADKVDVRKAEKKVKDIYDMKAELKIFRIKEMERFKEILSAEQRKKLRSCAVKEYGHGKGGGHGDKQK